MTATNIPIMNIINNVEQPCVLTFSVQFSPMASITYVQILLVDLIYHTDIQTMKLQLQFVISSFSRKNF